MILDTSVVAAQRAAKAADVAIAHYSGLLLEAKLEAAEAKLAEAEAVVLALRSSLIEERAHEAVVAEELQTTTGLYWRLRSDYALLKRRQNEAEADYANSLASANRLLLDKAEELAEAKAEAARHEKRADEAELAARTYKACYGYASRDRAILEARLTEAQSELAEELAAHKFTAEAARSSRLLYEAEVAAHDDTAEEHKAARLAYEAARQTIEELSEELNEERSEAARLARRCYEELTEEREANHAVIGSLIYSEEQYKLEAEAAEERAELAEERAKLAARQTSEVLTELYEDSEPLASDHLARYYIVLEDTDLERANRSGSLFYQWAYSTLDKAEAKIEAEAEADSAIQLLYLARIIRYGPALDS